MTQSIDRDQVAELVRTCREDLGNPFPYTGCRKLLHGKGISYEGLIPDLDLYFYEIASHCGGIKNILKWSQERLLAAQTQLSKSFFERHPEYQPLEPMITKEDTPDLYSHLMAHEKVRRMLLELLNQLLSEDNRCNSLKDA